MYDFHMHSKYSDGAYDVNELLEKVQKNNIKYFSLTDHDTITGSQKILLEYQEFLNKNNIKFIIGAEFSTFINGVKTHLLAYDFDYTDENMLTLLKIQKASRHEQTLYRLKKLKEMFNITLSEDSMKYLENRDNVTKPDLAECLKNDGFVTSRSEGFKEYLDKIPKKIFHIDSETAIKLVHFAKGKIFLAHPFGETNDEIFNTSNIEPYIKSLVDLGIDGMECYYSAYTSEKISLLLNLAKKYNLLISAGSDFHGTPGRYADIGQISFDGTKVDKNLLSIISIF